MRGKNYVAPWNTRAVNRVGEALRERREKQEAQANAKRRTRRIFAFGFVLGILMTKIVTPSSAAAADVVNDYRALPEQTQHVSQMHQDTTLFGLDKD